MSFLVPEVVDLSSISLTIQPDLIQISSLEFKALDGTLEMLKVSSVTPTITFVGGVNEVGRYNGSIGMNITDATTNYTIEVRNINTCGQISQATSFTACFRKLSISQSDTNLVSYRLKKAKIRSNFNLCGKFMFQFMQFSVYFIKMRQEFFFAQLELQILIFCS